MNTIVYKADGELVGSMLEREDDKIFRILVKRANNDFVVASYVSGQREWFGGHYYDGVNAFNMAKARFMYDLMETMPSPCINVHPRAAKLVQRLYKFLIALTSSETSDDENAVGERIG